jgi:hypothetical protein
MFNTSFESTTSFREKSAWASLVSIQILVQVPLHIAMSLRSRREHKDERDRAIESKSFRIAYGVLAATFFTLVGSVVISALPFPDMPTVPWLAPVFLSQIFFLCFVVAEATKYLTQAICYRRGI